MRKKIMLGAILLTAAIGASASSVGFISWCGEQAVTVSKDYYEDPDELEDYYQELNDILCGSGGSYTIVP